ncbi:MAG: hypothetical protein Q9217_005500 [Psora testacea]
MSGIPIHMEDPISPAKSQGVTPQTSYIPASTKSSQPVATTSAVSYEYPPARPGAAIPKPTRTLSPAINDPPPPQPGAVPAISSPTTTAKATLPPPPKAGERPQPPQTYAPTPTTSRTTPQQNLPPQMSCAPPNPSTRGIPQSSTVSASTNPTLSPSERSINHPTSTNSSFQASLEHPRGYHQNRYASDLKPEQRFAVEQEERLNHSDSLEYPESRPRVGSASARFDEVGEAWEGAKKWVAQKGGEVGQKVGELHERVWESVGSRK